MRLNILRSQAAPTDGSTGYNNAWWGECTNGFNVRDTRRGWSYVLTAGHCTVGAYKAGVNYSYSSAETGTNNVGYEVYNFENGPVGGGSTYPQDYAIQPYRDGNTAGYWLGGGVRQNLVNSYCYKGSSTWQGCQEGAFAIRGVYSYDQIGIGWVTCGTGSGDSSSYSGYSANVGYSPGTRCGEVTRKNSGIVTNICTRPGDSGGPLFSEIDGRAYGILHGGYEGHGGCPTNPPGTEWSDYSPISVVMRHVNDQTVYLEGISYGFYVVTN
jgi:streptogrisin C